MIYDVAPGVLIETDEPISEEELEDARSRYWRGQKRATIAKALGGRVVEPESNPAVTVNVDLAKLAALVQVGEISDLTGLPVETLERMIAASAQ